ncbi:hypothetical protein GCM10022228_10970 [Halomonas cibimaris]|uniref:acylphosphatase n=1 Tax=Halomonas cibimaris TaxID=657012 RepID=A0ABP7LLY2_9GAMM
MIQGEEIRVYFIGGEYVAATARVSAFVIGDGQQTIDELIQAKNIERAYNPATAKALIQETPALVRHGRSRHDIPASGEWVTLGDSHMANQGAEYIALSPGQLSPALIDACRQAANLFPSAVCGVDVFVEDMTDQQRFWMTEINASTPAISAQFHFPRYGVPTEVASRLIEHAFHHQAMPVNPEPGCLTPAPRCVPLSDTLTIEDRLQQLAGERNWPFHRLKPDTLLLGDPAALIWTQGLTSRTPLESRQVQRDSAWLGERLKHADIARKAPKKGQEVTLLLGNQHVLAAYVEHASQRIDVTEHLHQGIVDIGARAMHALYRPGHATVVLVVRDVRQSPETQAWGIKSLEIQPDLSRFYRGIDQPRDVMAALLDIWTPLPAQTLTPESRWLHITGHVQGVGYRQWLAQQATCHALKAHIRNLPDGGVDAVVHGQPEAIDHLVTQCRQGPESARVADVQVDAWDGDVPQGIKILDTPVTA